MKRNLAVFIGLLLLGTFQYCSSDKKEDPTPVPPNTELNTLFSSVYLASQGFQEAAKTNATQDNKQVWVIKDLVGGKDLTWSNGRTIPSPMWPNPVPLYYTDEFGGYIFLPNLNGSNWLSTEFAPMAQPYDVYIVMRDVEAQQDEGYFAVSFSVRNLGDHLEYHLNSGSDPAVVMDKPFVPEFNKRSIIRLRIDGANSRIWINNVPVTKNGSPNVNLGTAEIKYLGYGSNSHVAQHDFYGMWVKFGTLSEAENKFVYEELEKQYKPGVFPDEPFASKIRAVGNNAGDPRVWTATYDFVSTSGTTEDTGKTEYQWGYFDTSDGTNDINQANIIAGATNKTLKRDDYPTIFTQPGNGKAFVFVIVKVYDTQGNSWKHFVRSPLAFDNY
jgi:hypothetical protein